MKTLERIESVLEEKLRFCEEYLHLTLISLDLMKSGSFAGVGRLLKEKNACIDKLSVLEEELRPFGEACEMELVRMGEVASSRIPSLAMDVEKRMKDILKAEAACMGYTNREKERVSLDLTNLNRNSAAAMSYRGAASPDPRFLDTWK